MSDFRQTNSHRDVAQKLEEQSRELVMFCQTAMSACNSNETPVPHR